MLQLRWCDLRVDAAHCVTCSVVGADAAKCTLPLQVQVQEFLNAVAPSVLRCGLMRLTVKLTVWLLLPLIPCCCRYKEFLDSVTPKEWFVAQAARQEVHQ